MPPLEMPISPMRPATRSGGADATRKLCKVERLPPNTPAASRTRMAVQTSGASVEMLFLAATWYLILTTVFSIGQYYLERYYARGSSRALPPTPFQRLKANLALFRRTPKAVTR